MRKHSLLAALFRTILLLLYAGLAVTSAHATVITKVSIDDVLSQNDVLETLHIIMEDNTQSSAAFSIPTDATNASINGKSIPMNETVNATLSCKTCNITIAYTIPGAVKDEGSSVYSLSRTLNFSQPLLLIYAVHLQPGSVITGQDVVDPSIVPQPTEIKTDGQSITVTWSQKFPALPQRFFIRYTGAILPANAWAAQLWAWLSLMPAFLIGIVLGAFLHKRYGKRKVVTASTHVPSSLLSPDERVILAVIKKHNGPIGQKELGKELNWSKSKVSALMTNLQHKHIIAREKVGRNYKVTLIKEIME